MFEQFFRILDRTEAGYLNQVLLSHTPLALLSITNSRNQEHCATCICWFALCLVVQ